RHTSSSFPTHWLIAPRRTHDEAGNPPLRGKAQCQDLAKARSGPVPGIAQTWNDPRLRTTAARSLPLSTVHCGGRNSMPMLTDKAHIAAVLEAHGVSLSEQEL